MTRVTEFPEDEPNLGKADDHAAELEPAAEKDITRAPRTRGWMSKLAFWTRLGDFYHGVKMEMRKTSWPTRTEVWSTTVVVLIAVFFFGFYLWGVDRLVTVAFKYFDSALGK